MGQINKDLADFKSEYEEKISKYIASQDLVGRYFISKVNTVNEGDWFVCVSRYHYLYNIYKVINQTDEYITCRYAKIEEESEHSNSIMENKDKRCVFIRIISESDISNLSFGQCVFDEYDVKPYFKILLDSDVKMECGGFLFRGDDEEIEKRVKEFVKERNGRNE